MHDVSLHILDIIENSLRAGAKTVTVSIAEDSAADRLTVEVADDGCGLTVSAEKASDPFYTTKRGKKTGLGLSLFRVTAEQAGGALVVERTESGGVIVRAVMQLSHVDRVPIGDIAETVAPVACTNPDVNFVMQFRRDAEEYRLATAELRPAAGGLIPPRELKERIRQGMRMLTTADRRYQEF